MLEARSQVRVARRPSTAEEVPPEQLRSEVVIAWAEHLRENIEQRAWRQAAQTLAAISKHFEPTTVVSIVNSMRGEDQRSPLHLAIEEGAPQEFTDQLIECGADLTLKLKYIPSHKTSSTYKLLGNGPANFAQFALAFERFDIYAQILQRNPTSITDGIFGSNTPLHYLCGVKNLGPNEDIILDLIKQTIALGLDPLRRNYSDVSPLSCALRGGHFHRAAVILSATPANRLDGFASTLSEVLSQSIERQDWDFVRSLLAMARAHSAVFAQQLANVPVQVRELSYPLLVQCITHDAPRGIVAELLAMGATMPEEITSWIKTSADKGFLRHVLPLAHFTAVVGRAHHVEEVTKNPQILMQRDARGGYPIELICAQPAVRDVREKIDLISTRAPESLKLRNIIGHNLLDQALLNGCWSAAQELANRGLRLGVFDEERLSQIANHAHRTLTSLAQKGAWGEWRQVLELLLTTVEEEYPEFLERVLKTPTNLRLPLAYDIVLHGATGDILSLVYNCGISFDKTLALSISSTRFGVMSVTDQDRAAYEDLFETQQHSQARDQRLAVVNPTLLGANEEKQERGLYTFADATLLHLAYASGSIDTIKAIERYVSDKTRVDAQGNPPHLYAFLPSARNRLAALTYAHQSYPERLGERNSLGVSAYSLSISHVKMEQERTLFGDSLAERYNFSTLAELEANLQACAKQGVFSHYSVVNTVARGFPLKVLESVVTAISASPDDARSADTLVRTLPYFFHGIDRELLRKLCYKIEYRRAPLPYQGETALMALLNHPKDPEMNRPFNRAVTTALTFTRHWMSAPSHELTGLQTWNWARTGTLAHSATRLAFDCWSLTDLENKMLTLCPALIESFGATRIQDQQPSIHGAGFRFVVPDRSLSFLDQTGTRIGIPPGTLFVLRRGYMLVSHPEVGTYIVGNKSPVFGRERLQEPGYFSFGGFNGALSEARLANITDETLQRHFTSILDPHGNHIEMHQRIDLLLSYLFGFLRAYECWKFNTDPDTAFTSIDGMKAQLVDGGHLSPGFPHFVNYLQTLHSLSQQYPGRIKMPKLAFMHPRYLPFIRHDYLRADGITDTTFTITRDALEVLGKMADASSKELPFTTTDLRRTGLGAFFQQAGFSKVGSLILVKDGEL